MKGKNRRVASGRCDGAIDVRVVHRVNLSAGAVWCAAASLAVSTVASAQQILEIHADGLTSYNAAATIVQGVRPTTLQRGVNIEGSMKGGSSQGWALAGNPFENAWRGETRIGSLDLATGGYTTFDVDLSLPSAGPQWSVGRTFNQQQKDGSTLRVSDGYQGKNWFQTSQPEIVFYDDATNTKDTVYIVYGADRFLEFVRTGESSNDFKGKNGAAGVIQYVSGSPDTYVYTDQHGKVTTFFGGNTSGDEADWQFWKMADAAGNTVYVGDKTSATDAVNNGYGGGKIELAYDQAGRRYTYSYTTIDSVPRLTEVKAETRTGSDWSSPGTVTVVGKVEYSYYTSGDSAEHSPAGYLKTVKVSTPLSDPGEVLVSHKHYRYYENAWADVAEQRGHPGMISTVVGFEGTRKYDWVTDSVMDDDFLTASVSSLKEYSEAFFEYESSTSTKRVSSAFFNGECGCGGGSNGKHSFTYESNADYTNANGYDALWASRVVVQRPDLTYVTQYFDETGQALSLVTSNIIPSGSTPNFWVQNVVRDSSGFVTLVHTPANTTAYHHADVAGPPAKNAGDIDSSGTDGLVWGYIRQGSGNLRGFVRRTTFNVGTGTLGGVSNDFTFVSSNTLDGSQTKTVGSTSIVRPQITKTTRHSGESVSESLIDSSPDLATSATTTVASGTLAAESSLITVPAIDVSANGAGSGGTFDNRQYFNLDGTRSFAKRYDVDDGASIERWSIDYTKYDAATGLPTFSVRDADVTRTGSGQDFNGVTIPGGVSNSGTPIHLKTSYSYDAQGRVDTTTAPDGDLSQTHVTMLKDRRIVRLSVPLRTGTTTKNYYGPVQYSVTNHAGHEEFSAIVSIDGGTTTTDIAGWINTNESSPTTALVLSGATLSSITSSVYSSDGQRLNESRTYFTTTFPGTDGTDYDAVKMTYDAMGRTLTTIDATGTITRSTYDVLGRVTQRLIGTDESRDPLTGDPTSSYNMVITEKREYDGNAIGGNSHLTKVIQDPDGNWGTTGDQRVTEYKHDARGRLIAQINPQSPHTVMSYDNRGRMTASAAYSSSSGLDELSVPTTTSNRIAYSTTSYDELNRAFQTVTHKINQSNGASSDTLTANMWYDAAGRVIKTTGSQISKTTYDRLGRATHQFVVAKTDDNTYADADDVAGDHVLEESQTIYEDPSGLTLFSVQLSRAHDDTSSTGPLDGNTDASLATVTAGSGNIDATKVRASITAMWYDVLDRPTHTAAYGTNGSGNLSTFTRPGSAPSPSDTVLVSVTAYDTFGRVQSTTDPKGLVNRTEYDAAGRKIKTIANYTDGTPGGGTNNDQDQTIKTEYSKGLQSKYIADLPSPEADQETVYIYGTEKFSTTPLPSQSAIAANNLLRAVKYPDSINSGTTRVNIDSDDDDVVSYTYNALGQQVTVKDQAGNIITTTYDTGGRIADRAVTTLASGFDGSIRRIAMTYLARGQVERVTQYNAASGGTAQDEVKYTYDDWGNLASFEQDVDSAIGGSGRASFTTSWSHARVAPSGTGWIGWETLRRTGMTMPNSTAVTYGYDTSGSFADSVSRVAKVTVASTDVATYQYLGLARAVGTDLPEPGLNTRMYGSGTADYAARLDRFGRIVSNKWTKTSTGIHALDLAITYDRNSNITSVDDAVLTGFDASYGMDNLNRLISDDQGTLSSGSITSGTRKELWSLTQTGNWSNFKRDLNYDGAWGAAGELNDTRTHNVANELQSRSQPATPSLGTPDFYLPYDDVGNMIDDGTAYKMEYDAFGRLMKVRGRGTGTPLIAEYRYNGLNHRISWHYNSNGDSGGVVDSSDPTYYFAYDDRWRIIATYRGTDANPKELFYFHSAGLGGKGGGSYVDAVILRDRDASTAWTAEANGIDERRYLLQNWRADVSVLTDASGTIRERYKYSAYGVPWGILAGDLDYDGFCDNADEVIFFDAYDDFTVPPALARADYDLDGLVEDDDFVIFGEDSAAFVGAGRGVLSSPSIALRIGYAGYQYDPVVSLWHVRHRVLNSELGRWTRRDPLGYVDGVSMFQLLRSSPIVGRDHSGLRWDNGGIGDSPIITPEDPFVPWSCPPNTIWNAVTNTCDPICFTTEFTTPPGPPQREACPYRYLPFKPVCASETGPNDSCQVTAWYKTNRFYEIITTTICGNDPPVVKRQTKKVPGPDQTIQLFGTVRLQNGQLECHIRFAGRCMGEVGVPILPCGGGIPQGPWWLPDPGAPSSGWPRPKSQVWPL